MTDFSRTETTTMNHPVSFDVEMPAGPRGRLSALVRPIAAIPHLLIVGGPGLALLGGAHRVGAFGALAFVMALIDWVAIVVTSRAIPGLQPLKRLYLGWRARALAFTGFLRDEFPPFGEGAYPAELRIEPSPEERDRADMLLRPILLIPHLVVLVLLLVVWAVAALISWFYLVITAGMPAGLWRFGREVMEYSLRVEAYALLLHDVFPPFPFSSERQSPRPAAPPRPVAVDSP